MNYTNQSIRILLIEDDDDDVFLFKQLLNKTQVSSTVERAASFAEGISKSRSNKFDVYFVDYHLGSHTGFELLEKLRKYNQESAIIMLTGQANEDLGIKAIQLGAEDYLIKGEITQDQLKRSIRYSLERVKLRQQQELLIKNQAKQREQQKTLELYESISDAFFSVDANWNFTYLNRHTQPLSRRSPKSLIGKNLWHEVPELINTPFERLFKKTFTSKKPHHAELYFEPQKNWYQLHVYPTSEGISVYFQIINRRKQQEEAIRRHKERLELAQSVGGVGIYEWDIPGNYITWSKEFEKLYNIHSGPYQENIDIWMKMLHPDDKDKFKTSINESLKTGHIESEWRIIKENQSIIWLQVRGKTFYSRNNEPLRMTGALIDITDRKQIEQKKEEFIGIASHELKTPVTSLKAYTQLLQRRFMQEENRELSEILGRMDAQVSKLVSLINEMLDSTRIQTGRLIFHPIQFDLTHLADEVIQDVQRTTSHHTIRREGNVKKFVFADRDRISQVMLNFLTNAIKFSPDGGQITVRIRTEQDTVRVEVKDTGIGIPIDKQDQIFERFYQVAQTIDKKNPGMGLGLYISAQIIKRHHGDIGVKSQIGKGSIFYFTLPFNT